MKTRWWVIGTVAVVGVIPSFFSDEITADQGAETPSAISTPPTDGPAPASDESTEGPTSTILEGADPADPDPTVELTEEPAEVPVTIDPSRGTLAIDAVYTLEVKGRAPMTGYDRDQFGQRWADIDRNGCDTRNDVLDRDLTNTTSKPGTHDCVVLTGTLISPYTGDNISFVRGQGTSSEVQIDHVVVLADAWQKGAQQFSPDMRQAFANDPLNLLAVDGRSNSQKGAGDAATWLPSNKSFRWEYVARQVAVKATYGLWVTQAEKDAMIRILETCPGQTLPSGDSATTIVPNVAFPPSVIPEHAAPSEPTLEPVPTAPTDVHYANCSEARAAGVTPLYEGDPGYRAGMDGDGDGIACE